MSSCPTVRTQTFCRFVMPGKLRRLRPGNP
jgi:hypothetical protein